jgi:hypothetical protein
MRQPVSASAGLAVSVGVRAPRAAHLSCELADLGLFWLVFKEGV